MKEFFGILLMMVGVLIAGTSGLCTLVVVGSVWSELMRNPAGTLSGAPILLIGIIPCAFGCVLVWIGNRVRRGL